MTRIALEFDFDLETSYSSEKPAKLNPPPGDPPETEEIEIPKINRIWVEGAALGIGPEMRTLLLKLLLDNPFILEKLEQAVRDEANA